MDKLKLERYLGRIKDQMKTYWPIWSLILIFAVIYRKWLSFEIFSFADYWFYFSETSRDYLHYSAWSSQASLGNHSIIVWAWAVNFLPGIFGYFGFDSNISDKFLIFWPFVFLTPLFTYLFAKQILKNKFGAFVAALVFSLNTYYLAINTQGHLGLSLGGTFAPLALYFFCRYFDDGRKKNLVAVALVAVFAGTYDFRVFYILFFIILAMPFYFLFLQDGYAQKKIFFRQHFSALAIFFSLILLLNIFWILPTAMTGTLASNDAVARPLVDNNFSLDLRTTMTLFHPFWNGSEPKWFDDKEVPLYFWLIPLMVVLGAYWQRKNKMITFWFSVALAAVFFSKQDAEPLKNAYVWLHQNFPGFNAYREASKFYFAIALSYAILIGSFVTFFFERFAQKKFLKYAIFASACLIFLWNAKPILTGEMHGIFTPKAAPSNEKKIRDHIHSQNGSFRTLWNPTYPIWASYSAYRPKVNGIETRRDEWKKIKDYADIQGGEPGGKEKNRLFFSESFAPRLFSQSAIRYLVSDEPNFFMVEKLLADPQWKKIDIGLAGSSLYENLNVRPRIYLTKNPESIHQENPFEKVDFTYQNPARWDFAFKKTDYPIYINFSESYHPDWRVICGETKWYQTFFAKNLFVADNHLKTDANLNAFRIDEDEIRTKCQRSADGKIKLSLFYLPQAYLYLGAIISGLAAIISLIYIFGAAGSRRRL